MSFDADTVYNQLRPYFQERIRRNEPLAHHCTFGVGGPADVWVSLETQEELVRLVRLCAERHWPLLTVGNSTNVLYADAGVRGVVARIVLDTYRVEDHGDGTALLVAEAGVLWPRLMRELAPLGWGGLAFGVGIPGTMGGGVFSNAGAHNQELGQVLEWLEVLDARGASEEEDQVTLPLIRRYLHDELDLGYRYSRFREQRWVRFDEQGHLIPAQRHMIEPPEIVMVLGIRLQHEDPEKLHVAIEQYKQYRKMTEPLQQHAGSVFKDPVDDNASHLIEQVGMKGRMHGQAQISERNPNYIVNLGGASASDIAALMVEAHQRVRRQFGVNLELDVELHGEW